MAPEARCRCRAGQAPSELARALQVALNLREVDLSPRTIGGVVGSTRARHLPRLARPMGWGWALLRWLHCAGPQPQVTDLLRRLAWCLRQRNVTISAEMTICEIAEQLEERGCWLGTEPFRYEITVPFWSPEEGDNLGLIRELCRRTEWSWREAVAGYGSSVLVPERHLHLISREIASQLQVPWGFLRPEDLVEDESNTDICTAVSFAILDELGIAGPTAVDACYALWPRQLWYPSACDWPQDSLGVIVAFLSWWWSEVEKLDLGRPPTKVRG